MDPSTIPHRATDRDLADDALAAALRDGDLRRHGRLHRQQLTRGGRRGVDAAPALVGVVGMIAVCAALVGAAVLATRSPAWGNVASVGAVIALGWWCWACWVRR